MKQKMRILTTCASLLLMATIAYATVGYFQGFESGTGDWVPSVAITSTANGGGALHLTASEGTHYAEIQNLHDSYSPGFGYGDYSFYNGADPVYRGDFYQKIDVYIDTSWAPAAIGGVPSFWIDMAPQHAADGQGEHNFQLTKTGSVVNVNADGGATFATLTSSGWYTFLMTFRKAPLATDPVISDLIVYNSSGVQQGATATVFATSPLLASADLHGNGYVWITLWQNGFAGDVLGLDNQRTGILGGPFRDVRRPNDINFGTDLGGTGHQAINFTGSAGSGGDTWITVYDETPADGTVKNTYGSVSLTADVLIHTFNNKKGAGLLALYNEPPPGSPKGLALIVFDGGNTDTLVLNTVDQAGKLTVLTTVALGNGIAENVWYRVAMNVVVSGGVTVTGTVTRHNAPTDPNSTLDGQVGNTLNFSGALPTGVTSPGEIGIIAAATSAVVDSSVTNFTHTP